MVQQAGGKKRRLGTKRHKVGRNGWAFETTAEALPWQRGAKTWQREPVAQIAAPMSDAPLSPGEHRESKTYRQRSLVDVAAPLAWSAVSSALIGVASVPVCVALEAKWFWPVCIWLGSGALAWFIASKDFLDDGKLITSWQTLDRDLEPKAPIVQPPAANIVVSSAGGKAQRRARLLAPASNHNGLWQYADALVRETAALSYEGGRHVNGAQAFGYTPAEFDGRPDAWRPTAITGGLVEPDPHKSKGYRLTTAGRRAFERVAEHQLGEWG